MNKDKVVGIGLLVASAAIIIVWFIGLFLPGLIPFTIAGMSIDVFLLKLTAFAMVAGVFGILAWIGYTLATTPPPKPIEELEKELEEELKKLEQEIKSEEQGKQ